MNIFASPKTIRAYQWSGRKNVGDMLTTPIVKYVLGVNVQVVKKIQEPNKLVCIGSVLGRVPPRDVVWGAGVRFPEPRQLSDVKVLAVRGRLSKKYISGVDIPDVYGDPGLLMPLVYNPKIEKKHKVGVVPHYVDWKQPYAEGHFLSVLWDWPKFIDELLSCEKVISSSLHGIVLAEAYGIPTEWAIWSERMRAKKVKFEDYLTGTDRDIQPAGPLPPITNLKEIQQRLIKALTDYVRI